MAINECRVSGQISDGQTNKFRYYYRTDGLEHGQLCSKYTLHGFTLIYTPPIEQSHWLVCYNHSTSQGEAMQGVFRT